MMVNEHNRSVYVRSLFQETIKPSETSTVLGELLSPVAGLNREWHYNGQIGDKTLPRNFFFREKCVMPHMLQPIKVSAPKVEL